MAHNKFDQHGSYTCILCHKLTRNTGHYEAELGYCKKCMFKIEMENAEDYGLDSDQYKGAKKAYEDCK